MNESEKLVMELNEPLARMLEWKQNYCQDNGIGLSVLIDEQAAGVMVPEELIALAELALDSAIETVCRVPGAEQRVIEAHFAVRRHFLVLKTEHARWENEKTLEDEAAVRCKAIKLGGSAVVRSHGNWTTSTIVIPL